MAMFRRVGAPELPPARFYVKGSYVLDFIFGRSVARDIDIFYDESCQRLTATEARAWLVARGLPIPEHASIDGPISVDGLDDCSGGGFPEFNIDRWHIRDDGNLYTLEDTNEEAEFGRLGGRSPFKTKVVPLDLDLAKKSQLEVLFPPYQPSGEDGLERVAKALRKMSDHPELLDPALKLALEAIFQSLRNGDDPAASGDAEEDGEFEIDL